ncbi:MAG: histone deacetylase [Microscillaceae bacterium]|nr:histone deacetylase [Microscillaceae bacterium]MDW8461644.1 histone deacetylase [Cytophagales bacterium]
MLKIAWHACYAHPLPEGHRFPMEKYTLIPEQLLYEGIAKEENFFVPTAIKEDLITTTHEVSYWHKLKNLSLTHSEIRATGFPLSQALIDRERIIAQGTVQGALFALQYGIAMNIAGGTHHAFTYKGEGFCLLNDIALAANYLLSHTPVQRILIVDLDVHQGNGTAQIFQHNSQVFTFSMHGEKNYPFRKEISDIDIPLPDGITDKPYLDLLEKHLWQALETHQPDFLFYQAGVDILETDKLGRLAISRQGCLARDKLVLGLCAKLRIPVQVSMGGGYSPKINDIVQAHVNTFRVAQEVFF